MKSLRSLQELIFPTRCLGCSALGLVICSQCRAYWHPHIYRQRSKNSPAIPIYSAISYSPMAGKIDRKSTRLNSSHSQQSRMPSSA